MRPRDSATARATADARAVPSIAETSHRWWGTFALGEGEAGLWRLGPLALGVERRAAEWRAGWSRTAAAASGDAARDAGVAEMSLPIAPDELPVAGEVARFAAAAAAERARGGTQAVAAARLRVEPALADRAVVARPEQPFALLPGERVVLHVAIPVRVRLALEDGTVLVEVPSERLRETWLGASTTSGELCWMTPVPLRLVRERLSAGAHLARVEVTLTNRAEAPLLVERVSVPVSHLALWWQPEHGLLANGVVVERDAGGSTALLRIAEGPPVPGAEPIAPARQPEPRLGLVRALEAWLG